ncbi:hypothetical protein X777_08313 [Ooceraea biroi]|uniref:Uncharacterized protein n=1 Tax=Ooceraea biroi TaxID=2015173 RepID=A0A026WZG4_OOCBI|nr:hypothetical protein X777_08313 [Ooceraea biroi]
MRVGASQRGATTFNREPFLTLNCSFDTDDDNSASSARSDGGSDDALSPENIENSGNCRRAQSTKRVEEISETINSME